MVVCVFWVYTDAWDCVTSESLPDQTCGIKSFSSGSTARLRHAIFKPKCCEERHDTGNTRLKVLLCSTSDWQKMINPFLFHCIGDTGASCLRVFLSVTSRFWVKSAITQMHVFSINSNCIMNVNLKWEVGPCIFFFFFKDDRSGQVVTFALEQLNSAG